MCGKRVKSKLEQKGTSAEVPFFMSLALPERFERPTPWFVAKYSIQLSYGRAANNKNQPSKRLVSLF